MNHPSAGSSGEPPIGSSILGPAIPPLRSSDAPPAKLIDGDLGPFISGDGIPATLPPAPQPRGAGASESESPAEELPWLVSPEDIRADEAETLDAPDSDRPPWEASSLDEAYGPAGSGDAEVVSIDDLVSREEEHSARQTEGGGEHDVDRYLSRPVEGPAGQEPVSASRKSTDEDPVDDSAAVNRGADAPDADSTWRPWADLAAPDRPESPDDTSDAADFDRKSSSGSGSLEQAETREHTADVPATEEAAADPFEQQAEVEGARDEGAEGWRQPERTDETPPASGTDPWEQREDSGDLQEHSSSDRVSEEAGSERIAVPLSSHEIPDVSDLVLEEIASRLERIAHSLRSRDGGELSGDVSDPLEVLITGYALGYSEGVRRSADDRSHEH
jgi:hypothetical protein